MKKTLSTNKGTLLMFAITVFVLAVLSLFLLFAGIYEVAAILGISGFFTFFVLMIMLMSNLKPSNDNVVKPGSFIGFSILRVFLIACSIGLSFVLLYFTNIDGNKFRYLYVLVSGIPLIISIVLYILKGRNE